MRGSNANADCEVARLAMHARLILCGLNMCMHLAWIFLLHFSTKVNHAAPTKK
jgi:hypothetical protein